MWLFARTTAGVGVGDAGGGRRRLIECAARAICAAPSDWPSAGRGRSVVPALDGGQADSATIPTCLSPRHSWEGRPPQQVDAVGGQSISLIHQRGDGLLQRPQPHRARASPRSLVLIPFRSGLSSDGGWSGCQPAACGCAQRAAGLVVLRRGEGAVFQLLQQASLLGGEFRVLGFLLPHYLF